RVGKRQVPLLREEALDVEIGREAFVELDALPVEIGTLRRAVVGPDDGRVPPGGARADVALLEDGHVRNPVVLGQVVRGRKAVRAAADNYDVVLASKVAARAPHAPDPED